MRNPNINYAREEVCHNCLYCSLNTAGQHEPDCPLAKPQKFDIDKGIEGVRRLLADTERRDKIWLCR